MKYFCFLFIFLFTSLTINAQIVNIPDVNFKDTLVNSLCVDTNGDGDYDSDADVNNDGEIQVEEAEAVNVLNVNQFDIMDLTGIESFINLTSLECSNNNIAVLDLSQNLLLEYLNCASNNLTNLTVSYLLELVHLDFLNNQITEIDVTNNTNLEHLDCSFNSNMNNIDLSNNIALKLFWARDCDLTAIDVTQNINLEFLKCGKNDLTEVNLVNNIYLEELAFDQNLLTEIDFSNSPNITFFTCFGSSLLTNINAKTTNNSIINYFSSRSCPNLQCIYVDDSSASYLSSWQKDDHTNFVNNQTECDALSVEGFEFQNSINVYPNPVNDILNLKASTNITSIQIYNLFGQELHFSMSNSLCEEINISNYNSGVYLVKVKIREQTAIYKIIKE